MLHSVPSTERRLSDEKAFSKLSNGKTVAKAQGENAVCTTNRVKEASL